jgi:Bacterial Ig-like domain (group 2)
MFQRTVLSCAQAPTSIAQAASEWVFFCSRYFSELLLWSLHSSGSKSEAAFIREAKSSNYSATLPAPIDSPTPCCDDSPHLLVGTYYSVKHGLDAKLLLNNKAPHPIEIKPTLFSMSGESHKIAPVTVEGNSFQILDMSSWIAAAGPQFREGSIQVFHLGPNLVIGAQVYLEDDAHSLAFEEKFAEPANFHSSQLRGAWWLPTQKGEVLLALSNTSDSAVTATARADGQRPTRGGSATVELSPHETRLLNVQEDLFGNDHGAMSRLGGISVEHNGPAGAVLARGFAQENECGYSLAVQFADPQGAKSWAYQGAGLRLGVAGGEALTPVAVAYNASAEEATVTGRMPYTTSDGATAEVSLPEVRLSPGESREIDVAAAMSDAGMPADVSAAGLEFEYSTGPGSVQMTALSVGASGNQVFRVPLWDVSAQRSATGGYPWRIEGDSSTFVYLKNTTDQPQDYTFQMSYDGGFYVMGLKTIGARQTIALDLRALRDCQTPDVYGKTIPLTADRGQVVWSVHGTDGLAMIGRSEQVDEVLGVSSSYACQYCCPNSFYQAALSPQISWSVGVGATTQFVAYETDKNCYGNPMMPHPVINGVTWTSTNTSAATINSSGLATGVAPGSSGINARWTVTSWTAYWQGCSSYSYQITSPSTALNVIQVNIKLPDGTNITNTTRNVIVGQEINLSTEVLPAGTTFTNPQWTIPGNVVANYTIVCNGPGTPPVCQPPTSAQAPGLSDLTTATIDYYWVDGGDGRQVQYSVSVKGNNIIGTATFNVKRPTAQITATTNNLSNAVALDSRAGGSFSLHFGLISAEGGPPGVAFTRTVNYPSGFSGDVAWVQVVTSSTISSTDNNGSFQSNHYAGLDTSFPYSYLATTEDSPRLGFPPCDYQAVNDSDSFTMWLMFRPSNTPGNPIWVPLRSVDWNWSGGGGRFGNFCSWILNSSSHSTNPTDSDTTTFPQWTMNAAH